MQFDVGSGMGYRKIREPEGLTSFDELPIIDLSDIESADETKLRAVASKIYDACTKVGFFYIKNHGIPKESVAAIKKEAERYFKASYSLISKRSSPAPAELNGDGLKLTGLAYY
ncbi:hypothetical protein LTR99_001699 [Exophiala xenobiotica]|uniref:Non-haem dioxygenase N-terminal domain-containing protein n=1 Tax=Vermiconidia calcicola TaxID=1690605 RepID=A0AAV9QL97_9PEZI|nr:hypothetical protein LTR99_001699 [Exophiala xenobiotica]KAK5544209.1 hypothetical protein LTR25_001824 [Vermiconidia calcicola]